MSKQIRLKLKIVTDFLEQYNIGYEIKTRTQRGNQFYLFKCNDNKEIRIYRDEPCSVYTHEDYRNYCYEIGFFTDELRLIKELRIAFGVEDILYKMDNRRVKKDLDNLSKSRSLNIKLLEEVDEYENIADVTYLKERVLERCSDELKDMYYSFKKLEIGQSVEIKNVERNYHRSIKNVLKGKVGVITHISNDLEAKIKVDGYESDEIYWHFTQLKYQNGVVL